MISPVRKAERSITKAAMPSSCMDIREALAKCVQQSDCVLIERNTPADCLTRPDLSGGLPMECKLLRSSFYECKRGLLDMRKRFRGNAPIAQSRELEDGGTAKVVGPDIESGREIQED